MTPQIVDLDVFHLGDATAEGEVIIRWTMPENTFELAPMRGQCLSVEGHCVIAPVYSESRIVPRKHMPKRLVRGVPPPIDGCHGCGDCILSALPGKGTE